MNDFSENTWISVLYCNTNCLRFLQGTILQLLAGSCAKEASKDNISFYKNFTKIDTDIFLNKTCTLNGKS